MPRSTAEVNELVTEHAEWAKRMAWLLVKRAPSRAPHDWESIALEGVWEAARGWRPELGNFKTYAYRIVRGRVLDGWRAGDLTTRHERATLGDDAPVRTLTPIGLRTLSVPATQEEEIDARRAWERMEAKIDTLPPKLQVVLLRRLRGDGLREIGAALRVTESRACQMLHEALRRLDVTPP